MKFGIVLECDQGFENAIAQAVRAEELGYDGIFIPEHHNYEGYVPQPLIALAAIAQATKKIEIASFILILPLYYPVLIAEMAAQLDYQSNGRLILGVGLGYVEEEFNSMSVPYEHRVSRMEESIPLLRRLWTEDDVSHSGKRFKFSNATIYPKAKQLSGPPIWIGGWVESAIRRAARLADAWVPGPTVDREVLEWCFGIFDDELTKAGKTREATPVAREVFCAPTEREANMLGGRLIYDFYQKTYLQWPHPHLKRQQFSYDELLAERFIVGDPDTCEDQIRLFEQSVEMDYLICRMQHPRLSQEQAMASIELFAKEVIPRFK